MEFNPVWLIGISLGLALVPMVLGIATSYLKVNIVFGLLRNALGTQQIPGPIIISALSIALTAFIMGPTFSEMKVRYDALPEEIITKPVTRGTLEKLVPLFDPLREFLDLHSGAKEREFLLSLRPTKTSEEKREESAEKSWSILIPAFMLTELKEGFSMGFIVLLPFLIIDLIVANILTGMGMFMMSPMTISLPLKLILFVSSDAWLLIIKGLIHSYEVS